MQEGANWVQGTDGSWLWDLVKSSNTAGVVTDWDSVYVKAEGRPVSLHTTLILSP